MSTSLTRASHAWEKNSEPHGIFVGGAAAEEGQAAGPGVARGVASPPSRCPSAALLAREDSVDNGAKSRKGAD